MSTDFGKLLSQLIFTAENLKQSIRSEMEPVCKIYKSMENQEEGKAEKDIDKSFDSETFVLAHSIDGYNLNAIGHLVQVVNLLIESIVSNMQKILDKQTDDVEDTLIDIMYVSAMFRCAPEFFKQVLDTDCEDFLYYPKTSVQWRDLHKVYK